MGFNREIDHYEVKLEHPTSGRNRPYTICRFDTEEEAVAFAREKMKDFKVTVRALETIVGWETGYEDGE